MHQKEFEKIIQRIENILVAEGVIRNCTMCGDWNHEKEICNKYKVQPPIKVIVKGCPEFYLIPF